MRFTRIRGRHSIAPGRLLRAWLLQCFDCLRSERMRGEQSHSSGLFRWFVGVDRDEPVWNHAVCSTNREGLLNQEVARRFFDRVLKQAQPHRSDEPFPVDGTFLEAWASPKSFQKKDGGEAEGGSDLQGPKRTHDTHASTTDPDARLCRQGHGQEAQLRYLGPVRMENRQGWIVDALVPQAEGTAERDAALRMVYKRWKKRPSRGSPGADQAYDRPDFVPVLRDLRVRPQVTRMSTAPAAVRLAGAPPALPARTSARASGLGWSEPWAG